jgi:hypothetical protein
VSLDSTFVETRRLQIAVVYDSDAKKIGHAFVDSHDGAWLRTSL